MKLKTDENLGLSIAGLLRQAGHDVATVVEQGLRSSTDPNLIQICRTEGRCLVTLDMDFSNPLRFKPSDYSGIAVLRLPSKPTPQDMRDAIQTLIARLTQADITGRLWIVQRGKVREYQEEDGSSAQNP